MPQVWKGTGHTETIKRRGKIQSCRALMLAMKNCTGTDEFKSLEAKYNTCRKYTMSTAR
jgi:hypothetical protein